MKIASSTYYVALTRLKSAREIRDEELKRLMQRAYDGNYKVYGARKVWWELREGMGWAGAGWSGSFGIWVSYKIMGLAGAVRGGDGAHHCVR